MSNFEENVKKALASPQNQGEMENHDAVGTVGSADCGDMLRMWLKYKEKDGEKVIDKASFQSFGCQTAIAVASMTTQLLQGKTVEEAKELDTSDLTGDLGELPPMKIHCGDLVHGALQNALGAGRTNEDNKDSVSNTLLSEMNSSQVGRVKVIKLSE